LVLPGAFSCRLFGTLLLTRLRLRGHLDAELVLTLDLRRRAAKRSELRIDRLAPRFGRLHRGLSPRMRLHRGIGRLLCRFREGFTLSACLLGLLTKPGDRVDLRG